MEQLKRLGGVAGYVGAILLALSPGLGFAGHGGVDDPLAGLVGAGAAAGDAENQGRRAFASRRNVNSL